MKNIGLLIRKDFFSSHSFLFAELIFVVAWVLTTFFVPGMSLFFSIIIVYSMSVSSFSVEDNQTVTNINNMLPISRNQQIMGRYLYTWIIILAVSLGNILIQTIADAAGVTAFRANLTELFIQVLSVCLLLTNINIPAIYRFGIQKARLFTTIIYMAAILATSSLHSLLQNGELSALSGNAPFMVLLILAGVSLLLTPVSVLLSKKWAFEK